MADKVRIDNQSGIFTNMNTMIRFKPNDHGKQILKTSYVTQDEFEIDGEYYRCPLWLFVQAFGKYEGTTAYVEDNHILIEV